MHSTRSRIFTLAAVLAIFAALAPPMALARGGKTVARAPPPPASTRRSSPTPRASPSTP